MSTQTERDSAIKAAMQVARDVTAGTLDPANLDDVLRAECRAEFAAVAGPGDPLWDLHLEVARDVLRRNGIPAGELAEWLAVSRRSEAVDAEAVETRSSCG